MNVGHPGRKGRGGVEGSGVARWAPANGHAQKC